MSKIERFQGDVKAFASNAQGLERTVFGGTTQANDLTSQVTAAFLRGWGIVGPSEHPSLEDFNAAMFAMSQFIAYQHQIGVPEWHTEQEYYTGSVCTHGGVSYQSLVDDSIGNEPPSAQWTPVLTAGNGGEYFQPKNGNLAALAALSGAANRLPYFTAANALALTTLTAAGRDLIGKADVAAMRTYLELGTAATVNVGTGTNQIPDMNSFTHDFDGGTKHTFVVPMQDGIFRMTTAQINLPVGTTDFTFPNPFPNTVCAVMVTQYSQASVPTGNLSARITGANTVRFVNWSNTGVTAQYAAFGG